MFLEANNLENKDITNGLAIATIISLVMSSVPLCRVAVVLLDLVECCARTRGWKMHTHSFDLFYSSAFHPMKLKNPKDLDEWLAHAGRLCKRRGWLTKRKR